MLQDKVNLEKPTAHCPDLSYHHYQDTRLVIRALRIDGESPYPNETLNMCCLVLLKVTIKFMFSLKILYPYFGVFFLWFQWVCCSRFPCWCFEICKWKVSTMWSRVYRKFIFIFLSQVPNWHLLSLWHQGDTQEFRSLGDGDSSCAYGYVHFYLFNYYSTIQAIQVYCQLFLDLCIHLFLLNIY